MVMVTEIQIPEEAQALMEAAENQLAVAQTFTIATVGEYQEAGDYLKAIKRRMKELEEAKKAITRPLDESKKRVFALFAPPENALKDAESLFKRAILAYQQEEERKRREEEAKLQAIAAAEQRRRDALAAKQAQKAEERGDLERAEEIRDNVPVIPVPAIASEAPRVEGISTRLVWKFRIIDMDLIPREYMSPNEKMLGDLARATKGVVQVLGVEFYSEEIIASGSR